MLLTPKKTKHRFNHYPKYEGKPKGNTEITYGDIGLQVKKGQGSYISSNQIEAARRVISPFIKKEGGKLLIKIFPHWGKTKKPLEVRMGSGKGSIENWKTITKKGNINFEIKLQNKKKNINEAYKVLEKASRKLPKRYQIIEKPQY